MVGASAAGSAGAAATAASASDGLFLAAAVSGDVENMRVDGGWRKKNVSKYMMVFVCICYTMYEYMRSQKA